jgi:hypothetical protein
VKGRGEGQVDTANSTGNVSRETDIQGETDRRSLEASRDVKRVGTEEEAADGGDCEVAVVEVQDGLQVPSRR